MVVVNELDEDEFVEDDKVIENEFSLFKLRIDEVFFVVWRFCNEEVIVGSYMYFGCGVYLFKFDNFYLFFRLKILYYCVYYI